MGARSFFAKNVRAMMIALVTLLLVDMAAQGQDETDAPEDLPPPAREPLDSMDPETASNDSVTGFSSPFAPRALAPDSIIVPKPDVPRRWENLSYLFWITKNQPEPVPLATDGTSVLLGGASINNGPLQGLRGDFGRWLDDDATAGIEFGAFGLFQQGKSQSISTNGGFLAIPFFDLSTATQNLLPVAASGTATGLIAESVTTTLYGFELNGVTNLQRAGLTTVDMIWGFRNVDLEEGLKVDSLSQIFSGSGTFVGSTFNAPGALQTIDNFNTRNFFYGGQLGGRFQTTRGMFTISGYGKLALGAMVEQANIRGTTTALGGTFDPLPIKTDSGVFANSGNIGRQSHTGFAVIPEVGMNVGYQLTPCLLLTVGYSILFMSNVVRPGGTINSRVDSATVPSSTNFSGPVSGESTRVFNTTDFWAQGLNVSLAFRF